VPKIPELRTIHYSTRKTSGKNGAGKDESMKPRFMEVNPGNWTGWRVACYVCRKSCLVGKDKVYFDRKGEPFYAYYCEDCYPVEAVLKRMAV
jgi:hypothetical protein